jgi:hypothetical protein
MTITAMPLLAHAGHGLGTFHGISLPSECQLSIGDQQAQMALRACQEPASPETDGPRSEQVHGDLLCLYCSVEIRLLEDRQLGSSLHLSAECPHCGCLRVTYVEWTAAL